MVLIQEKARILVVEDDPMDFVFVRKAFDALAAEIELFHCKAAQHVLSMIEERACRMVFLDLSLNGESGLDVLRTLRADPVHCAIPVIVFSSSGSKSDIQACYAAGANAYLEKPLTMELYRNFAERFSQFWLDIAKIP